MTIGAADLSTTSLREAALKRIQINRAKYRYLDFVQYTKPDYVADPVHRFLAAKLEKFVQDCEAKLAPRLLVKLAPQHGKSLLSSRHLPAWIIGRNPAWRVALMSYSADWARALSQDARDIFLSEPYHELWPALELSDSSTASDDWALKKKCGGGGMVAVGRDGSITGRSAEALVVDDPVKNRKEAESPTIRQETWRAWPEFRNRVQMGGGILVVLTAWHWDDFGSRLEQWQNEHPEADQFEIVNLQAIAEEDDPLGREEGEPLAPSRFDLAELKRLRASMPESDWQALYCGRPTSQEGSVFRQEWFRFEDDLGPKPGDTTFMTADTAYGQKKSSDFSVIQVWRQERSVYRLVDLYRERADFPILKQALIARALRFKPTAILVEDIGSGKSLIEDIRATTRLPILPWKPDRDKVARANAVTPEFEAGKVIFPKQAPWLQAYLQEMLRFPAVAHDDQVDTTSMAISYAKAHFLKMPAPIYHGFTFDKWKKTDDASGLYEELGVKV